MLCALTSLSKRQSVVLDVATSGMIPTLVSRLAIGAVLASVVFGLSVQLGSADVEIEDKKIKAFIEAALAVDHVMDKWQPKIIQASSSDEAETLHGQANAEIRAAIEGADGISLDEYQSIREAIAADSAMLDRVTEIMWQQRNQ